MSVWFRIRKEVGLKAKPLFSDASGANSANWAHDFDTTPIFFPLTYSGVYRTTDHTEQSRSHGPRRSLRPERRYRGSGSPQTHNKNPSGAAHAWKSKWLTPRNTRISFSHLVLSLALWYASIGADCNRVWRQCVPGLGPKQKSWLVPAGDYV